MRISGTRWTALGVTLVALLVAGVLTANDMRLASSQTVTLVAKLSEDAVPVDDPFSEVWDRASPVEVPLSVQNLTPPKAGSEKTLTARALHDGKRVYILAEWKDGAEDTLASSQTEFTDAVAVQFPVTEGEQVPNFCMGAQDAPVNIWQWKAAWQADMVEGFVDVEDVYPNMYVDLYPFEDESVFYPAREAGNVFAETNRATAADNLLAGAFGTLVQSEDQVVEATGEWRKGEWRVVFVRDEAVEGEYTQFAEGKSNNLAFAVWDGAENERDGMKSVSQFLMLDLSDEVAKGPAGVPLWAIILVIVGGVAVAALAGAGYVIQRRRA